MFPFKQLCCFAAFAVCLASPTWNSAQMRSNTVLPGAIWKDTQGDQIEAHGGGVIRYGGQFFWLGEDRTQGRDPAKRYVSCYTSSDLVHWKGHHDALALADPEHLGPDWVLERPKIYHNRRTSQFVMYFHLDDSQYRVARVGVATSASPCGPYTYVHSFRPFGEESRDIGQFVDDDGTAYLIFESRPTKGFFIAKLTIDYLNVSEMTSFVAEPLEGGALVHLDAWYYVIGSHMTGWRSNPDVYAVSRSITGPWSMFRNISPPETNTYGSQPTLLLKIKGTQTTSVIYMGDIWNPRDLYDSRYLWMPLNIGGGKMHLSQPRPWRVDVITGAISIQ